MNILTLSIDTILKSYRSNIYIYYPPQTDGPRRSAPLYNQNLINKYPQYLNIFLLSKRVLIIINLLYFGTGIIIDLL